MSSYIDNNLIKTLRNLINSIDRKIILGDIDDDMVILFTTLVFYVKYCIERYASGQTGYLDKLINLKGQLDNLNSKCKC